ncbi:hypothetical protein P0W64_18730 [Tsukamurella sp. 8F]|uniref:hypothetical protein n=1 Tax=unclassified Tsukamurella TaxID=2633480 RepID=UPI0023B97835|nr:MULTISPECIES: hypothetical protein [unclassified Tsukamurella]MDF0532351.1 hypothetical protein [Tsukamurella sp. 8J]MDF0588819.1 hypothetical protein [Tsukamurella sp. 8F]
MITRGTRLSTPSTTGRRVQYRVAAIRRAPFSYVELEPLAGGPRRTVSMRVAESLQASDDSRRPVQAERGETS